jgi:N-acetylmuramoyl-L-alanine amidase
MSRIYDIIIRWLSFIFGSKGQQIPIEPSEQDDSGTEECGDEMSGDTENTFSGDTDEITEDDEDDDMESCHKITVLFDNGHASSTPGKRSPKEEGTEQFFEYEFNRDIVRRACKMLDELGIAYEVLVPEVDRDVPLSERAERANMMYEKYGSKNCIFISVHSNAAGDGTRWMTARGWSCYTSKGETASDPYAEIFMREAEKVLVPMGRTIRKYSQNKYSWEENFTVLVKTKCPAVLTENLFYDNREEMKFLQTEEGRDAIARIHVNAILEIEKTLC